MQGVAAGHIEVFTRVRPPLRGEAAADAEEGPAARARRLRVHPCGTVLQSGQALFRFDACFDGRAAQADVYARAAAPLVRAVCAGVNAALIAYGQTGSGKTYTMLAGAQDLWARAAAELIQTPTSAARRGTPSHRARQLQQQQQQLALQLRHAQELPDSLMASACRGVIPRALEDMFAQLPPNTACACSYLEVYNEQVFDLLAETPLSPTAAGPTGVGPTAGPARCALDLQDADDGVRVLGLREVPVCDASAVLRLLWQGALRRAVEATDMNEHSSRSHTVFTVHVRGPHARRSKLTLVDLAGSEKWRTHQLAAFSARRVQEMTSINRSLSSLGNCVRALELGRAHVPFRDSKLTRLLQDSLSGGARASFLVALSPALTALDESLSSLQFADRAKRVAVFAGVQPLPQQDGAGRGDGGDVDHGEDGRARDGENDNQNEDAGNFIGLSQRRGGRCKPRCDCNAARAVAALRARVHQLESQLERAQRGAADAAAAVAAQQPATRAEEATMRRHVTAAAARLARWSERASGSGELALSDAQLAQAHERWLLETLVRGEDDEDDQDEEQAAAGGADGRLTDAQRIAMAEWAVLTQARQLRALQQASLT